MRNIYQFLLKSKRYGDFKTCLFYQRPSWILKKMSNFDNVLTNQEPLFDI